MRLLCWFVPCTVDLAFIGYARLGGLWCTMKIQQCRRCKTILLDPAEPDESGLS